MPQLCAAIMDPALLRQDELKHELGLRGCVTLATDSHHHLVSRILEQRNSPVRPDKVEELMPEREYREIRPKVYECEALTAECRATGAALDQSLRVTTLYVHLCHRLRRIVFQATGELFDDFKSLGRRFSRLHAELSPLFPQTVFPFLFIPEDEVAVVASGVARIIVKDDQPEQSPEGTDSGSDSSRSSRSSKARQRKKNRQKKRKIGATSTKPKVNPVTKWTLRYTRGEDLPKFLEDVEELANIHSVPDGELLRGLSSLLTGDARVWYRTVYDSIDSWEECKEELKNAFAPADNDESVMEKVNNLKQKAEETYVVFEAKMKQLFQRLTEPLSEKQKLKKVLAGLHVYYRSRIKSAEMRSLRDLAMACRDLEVDKPHILRLEREEEKKREHRSDKKYPKVNAVEAPVPTTEATTADAPVTARVEVAAAAPAKAGSAMKCWKCAQFGHFAQECPNRTSCFVCGMPDTVTANCGNCMQARAMGYWLNYPQQSNQLHTHMQGNPTGDWTRGNPVPGPVFPPPLHLPPPQLQIMQRPQRNANVNVPATRR